MELAKIMSDVLGKLQDAKVIQKYLIEYEATGQAEKINNLKIKELTLQTIQSLQKLLEKCEAPCNIDGAKRSGDEPSVIVVDDDCKTSRAPAHCRYQQDIQQGLVQIKADKNEVHRRIAAFISRKRAEADEWNVREFCSRRNIQGAEPDTECARIDATVIRHTGSKGHVRVSRVFNQYGPQTHCDTTENDSATAQPCTSTGTSEGVEERLGNMEAHMRISPGKAVSKDVYRRLKNLEERILFLEGISPDYFHGSPQLDRPKEAQPQLSRLNKRKYQDMSTVDIDSRIQALKDSLKQKQERWNNNLE